MNQPKRLNNAGKRGGSVRPAQNGEPRPGLAARMAAAKLLAAIVDKNTSADGLTDDRHGHPQYLALEPRDRSLVRAMLMTALRFRITIETLLTEQLEKPLPANARTLKHIFHIALAQILFLETPDRAAVDLAVAHASQDPRSRRFAALVNAVLRAIARRKETRLKMVLDQTMDAPEWFSGRLVEIYGKAKALRIIKAHRCRAPVDITTKADAAGWARRLGGFVTPTGSVRLETLNGPIDDLPGFADGDWWVQDAAAALPARLLGDVGGLHVVDLCAAPGGKTAQLAVGGAMVTAVDISSNRLKRLAENLDRLKLNAEIVACDIKTYQPQRQFDAVLLDVPCSSTGTIRRHPDVQWTKSAGDIAKLAVVQLDLLCRAARLVRPGGRIVFSNCSLDPAEGEAVVEQFLGQTSDIEIEPAAPGEIAGADDFITTAGFLRTTPADMELARAEISGIDGFFAARFKRCTP